MNRELPARWLKEAGVDEVTGETPRNFFVMHKEAPEPKRTKPEKTSTPQPHITVPQSASLNEAIADARKAADAAKNLAELRKAVESFEGCLLKKGANKTVFADGNPETRVMLIGEAPGADEDREGIPFCGMSGQLLDKVLKAIGLDRKTGFYITNTIFWRPPGNRKPTPEELAMCKPFLEKHIALVNPKLLLLVGATAVQAVLDDNSSMGKLRGQVFKYSNHYMKSDAPVMVTYHPSFLMRSPLNKRLGWEDMLAVDEFLNNQQKEAYA